MADYYDDWSSYDDSGGTTVEDVVNSVDGIDTGISNAETSPDGYQVVTLNNINEPSVINNANPDESMNVEPDYSINTPSDNQVNAFNNIVNSVATNPDEGGYDPYSSSQLDWLDQLFNTLTGVEGPTQVKNTTKKPSTNNKSANNASGGGMGSGGAMPLGGSPKQATPTQSSQQKQTTQQAATTSKSPIMQFLIGNPNGTSTSGFNISNIAIILTVITSLIVIYVFLKKGRT